MPYPKPRHSRDAPICPLSRTAPACQALTSRDSRLASLCYSPHVAVRSSGGGTLHSRPPREHYITASHIERWADSGRQVAVV